MNVEHGLIPTFRDKRVKIIPIEKFPIVPYISYSQKKNRLSEFQFGVNYVWPYYGSESWFKVFLNKGFIRIKNKEFSVLPLITQFIH